MASGVRTAVRTAPLRLPALAPFIHPSRLPGAPIAATQSPLRLGSLSPLLPLPAALLALLETIFFPAHLQFVVRPLPFHLLPLQ